MRLRPSVYATRIAVKHGPCPQRGCGVRTLCSASQADCAQLYIAAQRRRANQFGKSAARQVTVVVHLEQALLRMYPALHEIQIMFVGCPNMRNAFFIHRDSRRFPQTRETLGS